MFSDIVQAYADALYVATTLRAPSAPPDAPRWSHTGGKAGRDGVLRRLLRLLSRQIGAASAIPPRPFCRSYGQLPRIGAGGCPLPHQRWQDPPPPIRT